MTSALEGVRVLDLTQVLAGPFAVSLLADFGADVIMIEPPQGGFYHQREHAGFSKEANTRRAWNFFRNRRSISLNLRSPKGKDIFLQLVRKADVVIQNFAPGAMERLGLGYDVLKEANSSIIYCAISGFGQSGPYKDLLAYDPIIQATSGIMSMTGFPENPPVKVGISLADYVGALYSIIGILLALSHRLKTGEGQMIDCSMFDGLCHLTTNEIAGVEAMGKDRFGNRYPWAILDVNRTKDGKFILFTAQTDAQWESFLRLVGKENILAEKWDSKTRNLDRRDEVEQWAKEWLESKSLEEAKEELEKAKLPFSEITRMVDLKSDPQILARELLVTVADLGIGEVAGVRGIAPKLLGTPGRIDTAKGIAALGQHTEEILHQFLGYSREEIAELEEEKVI
jgi:CoA:oxalate CoA-transferase